MSAASTPVPGPGPWGRNPDTGELERVEPTSTGTLRTLSDAVTSAIGDAARYTMCSSFGCSTYIARLESVENHGDGTVTVTWTRERTGDGLIGEQRVDVLVGGDRIGGEQSNFISNEVTRETTGPGKSGDPVTLRLSSTFSDDSSTVTGSVPEPAIVRPIDCPSMHPTEVRRGGDTTIGMQVENNRDETVTFDLVVTWTSSAGGEPIELARFTDRPSLPPGYVASYRDNIDIPMDDRIDGPGEVAFDVVNVTPV